MKNVITVIVVFMLVGCGEAEATSKNNVVNKVVKPENKKDTNPHSYNDYKTYMKDKTEPVELHLDDMTFDEAFAIEHHAKGEGRTFWWRGDQYTTNLAEGVDEFVFAHTTYYGGRLGWVLNSNDKDDNCRSNTLDDCGVCDGPGKRKWFQDKDRDGLGTITSWLTSCTYPTDTEIEKFHEESLQEGGGDQGVVGE